MKTKSFLLLTAFWSMSLLCAAQTSKDYHPKSNTQLSGLSDQQKLKELLSINAGTFQFRISNENYSPVLTLDLVEMILNSRDQVTNMSIEVDEFIRVFIPSVSTIEASDFVPLEMIVYDSDPISNESNN